jgi:hypothetical protein
MSPCVEQEVLDVVERKRTPIELCVFVALHYNVVGLRCKVEIPKSGEN